MKRLTDFEINELVMKYSAETRPAVLRTAIMHAQEILADKNPAKKDGGSDGGVA